MNSPVISRETSVSCRTSCEDEMRSGWPRAQHREGLHKVERRRSKMPTMDDRTSKSSAWVIGIDLERKTSRAVVVLDDRLLEEYSIAGNVSPMKPTSEP